MHLLYYPHIRIGEEVAPDADAVRHLRALRLREGDHLKLTDGKGNCFEGRISRSSRQVMIEVLSVQTVSFNAPNLTLAVAPTKNHDRLEWLVEKAVEIGVFEILLLDCEHNEGGKVRHDRLERMAIAALKQSQRFYLPQIHPVIPFGDLLQRPFNGLRCLAHCYEDSSKRLLKNVLVQGEDALICIGPEGDFSRDEVDQAEQAGFIPVSLGKSRLRTETAGLAAVHTFDLINQR